MNHRSTTSARFALTAVAVATACLWTAPGWALGLGRLNVQSALGETLKAEIEVTSITPEEAASLRMRVAPAEAYRAAGIEYNAALASAQRLAPDAPETRMARGTFAYLCENDWPKALTELRAAETGLPNDEQLQYLLAITYRRLGLLPEALGHLQRAMDLNPYDARSGTSLVETLFTMRRYAVLLGMAPRFLSLFPDDVPSRANLVDAQYALDGDRTVWLRQRAALPPVPNDPHGLNKSYQEALRAGDLSAADQVLADPRLNVLPSVGQVISTPVALYRSELALLRGDHTAAKKHAAEASAF